MSIRAGVLASFSVIALAGCGGDPTGNGGGGDNGFTASIDGQAWASNAAPYLSVTSSGVAGSVLISGQQLLGTGAYRSISLLLGRIEGPGTYPLGVDGSTVAGGGATLIIATGNVPTSWATPLSGNAGSVTISSVTSTRIVGDFSFTAAPLPGQSGSNPTVTGGHFDLPLPNNFTLASGSSRASKMSGTIGGTAWNAAFVTPVGSLQTGAFVLGGSNSTTYSLTITPFPGLSQGLFPLAAGTTVMVIPMGGSANGWGSTGSTGSVTITSFAGGRVAGEFNVNLAPIGPGAGNMPASGTFDINLALTN